VGPPERGPRLEDERAEVRLIEQATMSKVIALVGLALAVTACGDKSGSAGSSSAASTGGGASAARSGGAAAPAPAKIADADIDKTVVENVKKASGCAWKSGDGFDGDCDAIKDFKTFSETYTKKDDEVDAAKQKKLVTSCLSLIGDPDPKVRWMAANCVGEEGEALSGDAASVDLVLAQLDKDPDLAVQHNLTFAAKGLDPFKAKRVDRVLATIEKFKTDEAREGLIASLLDTLTNGEEEPSTKVVDLAIELSKRKHQQLREDSFDILGKTKARAADACKVLDAFVESKVWTWSYAARTMGKMGDACKADFDHVVAVAVEKLGEDSSQNGKGLSGAAMLYLEQFLENPAVTKEQKSKIAAAAEALAKKDKNENVQKSATKLAEAAKK